MASVYEASVLRNIALHAEEIALLARARAGNRANADARRLAQEQFDHATDRLTAAVHGVLRGERDHDAVTDALKAVDLARAQLRALESE
jgi:hypothetical protein